MKVYVYIQLTAFGSAESFKQKKRVEPKRSTFQSILERNYLSVVAYDKNNAITVLQVCVPIQENYC